MLFPALGTSLRGPLMLRDHQRELFPFHLLQHLDRTTGVHQFAATTRAALVVVQPRGINLV